MVRRGVFKWVPSTVNWKWSIYYTHQLIGKCKSYTYVCMLMVVLTINITWINCSMQNSNSWHDTDRSKNHWSILKELENFKVNNWDAPPQEKISRICLSGEYPPTKKLNFLKYSTWFAKSYSTVNHKLITN